MQEHVVMGRIQARLDRAPVVGMHERRAVGELVDKVVEEACARVRSHVTASLEERDGVYSAGVVVLPLSAWRELQAQVGAAERLREARR